MNYEWKTERLAIKDIHPFQYSTSQTPWSKFPNTALNMASPTYTVPPLPYAYNALEPCISEQIMRLHHDKHHVAYVNNLNAALRTQSDTSSSARNESERLELQAVIQFNAGGHINHTLFWENLAPPSSPPTKESAGPKLTAALTKKWGSVAAFQEKFRAVLLGIRGSGWGWLVHSQESGDLAIISSKDQDPVPKGYKPLLGIDMWEHAYYLQYLNDKGGYVSKIWEIVNWEVVEGRFLRSLEEIYGSLQDLRATL